MFGLRAASPYPIQINALLVHAKEAMERMQSVPMDADVRRRIIDAYNEITAEGTRLKAAAATGTISDSEFRALRLRVTDFLAAVVDPAAFAEPIFPTATTRPAPAPSSASAPSASVPQALPEPSALSSSPLVLYGGIAAGALALGVAAWGYKKRGWFRGRRRR